MSVGEELKQRWWPLPDLKGPALPCVLTALLCTWATERWGVFYSESLVTSVNGTLATNWLFLPEYLTHN